MKIRIGFNELDLLFLVNIVIGVAMFLFGACYDVVADKFLLSHNSNQFPLLQVLWCIFWAGYVAFNIYYQKFYGE